MSRRRRIVIITVLVIAALIVPLVVLAQEDQEDTGTAFVIVANFSPDAPAVDIYIDGALIGQELTFPAGTLPVEISAGPVWVEARYSSSADTDPALVAGEAILGKGDYYIIPIMNITERAQFGAYRIPVYDPLGENETRVQFFHSVPQAPRMDVIDFDTEEVKVPALDFGYVEDPVTLPNMEAGVYHWQVWTNNEMWTNAEKGTGEPPVLAFDMGALELKARTIYSFYMVGSPAVDMPILALVLAMPYGGGLPAQPPVSPSGTPPTQKPTATATGPTPTITPTFTPTPTYTPTATPTPTNTP
jgi:hypothetical protein